MEPFSHSSPISVYLRLRPLSLSEKTSNDSEVWSTSKTSAYLSSEAIISGSTPSASSSFLTIPSISDLRKLNSIPKSFTFSTFHLGECFPSTSSNECIFEVTCRPYLPLVLEGFNFTLFAFGQTGSGKTFTMLGSESIDFLRHKRRRSASPCRNLIGRVKIQHKGLSLLFIDEMMELARASNKEIRVLCSYFEIYNENVFDLLGNQDSLPVCEDPARGFFIKGLTEKPVKTFEETLELICLAEGNRRFSSTEQNSHSSRSHVVIRLVVLTGNENFGFESVINFVDLAGSERLNSKKVLNAESMNEGKHINTSLFYLCSVILKLSEKASQGSHVPYRNSNLTKILRNSLGGNSFTSIICTASPSAAACDMTLGTMTFADSAKKVTNKVFQNFRSTSTNDLLKSLQSELLQLKTSNLSRQILKETCEKSSQTLEQEKSSVEEDDQKKGIVFLQESLQALELENRSQRLKLQDSLKEQNKLRSIQSDYESKIASLEEKIKDLQTKNSILEGKSLPKMKYDQIEDLEKFYNRAIDLAKDFKINRFKSRVEERKSQSSQKLRKVLQPILIDKENIN